jgi:UDP-glucuronate 4-epimerase
MKILVTGISGFIGYHLTQRLCENGHHVVGIDKNQNSLRLVELGINPQTGLSKKYDKLIYKNIDICESVSLGRLFEENSFEQVIHLAAKTGVRESISLPEVYTRNNIDGFLNILEACKIYQVKNLIYASSSSVYGNSEEAPFSPTQSTENQQSIYAVTKKTNELMAQTYFNLYGLPSVGLRLFTVYGPWGREDMAPYKFVDNIYNETPIDVYNYGEMERDFTYIDDVVESFLKVMSLENYTHKILNVGSGNPIGLMTFIKTVENVLGKKPQLNMLPMQLGDVKKTYADLKPLNDLVGNVNRTSIEEGVSNLVKWYIETK